MVSACIGVVYWKSRLRVIHRSDSPDAPLPDGFVSADRSRSNSHELFDRQPLSFEYYAALVVTLLFFGISLVVHIARSVVDAH